MRNAIDESMLPEREEYGTGEIHGNIERYFYAKTSSQFQAMMIGIGQQQWPELDNRWVDLECQLKVGIPGVSVQQEMHCDNWYRQLSGLLYLSEGDSTMFADLPYEDIGEGG